MASDKVCRVWVSDVHAPHRFSFPEPLGQHILDADLLVGGGFPVDPQHHLVMTKEQVYAHARTSHVEPLLAGMMQRAEELLSAQTLGGDLSLFDLYTVPLKRHLTQVLVQLDRVFRRGWLDLLPNASISRVRPDPSSQQSQSVEFHLTKANLDALYQLIRWDLPPSPGVHHLPSRWPQVESGLPGKSWAPVIFISWTSRHTGSIAPIAAQLAADRIPYHWLHLQTQPGQIIPGATGYYQVPPIAGVEGALGPPTSTRTVASLASGPDPYRLDAWLYALTASICHTRQPDLSLPHWSWLAGWYEFLYHVVQHTQPQQIVVCNDTNPLARTAIALARRLGVQTTSIQHGAWIEGDLSDERVVTDHLWVMGHRYAEHARQWRNEVGGEVRVMGQPRFDAVQTLNKDVYRAQVRALFEPVGSLRGVVVLALQTYPMAFCRRQILDVLLTVPDAVGVLVAPHPAQPRAEVAALVTQLEGQCPAVRLRLAPLAESNRHYFCGADVLVTYYSTAAIEAVLCQTPVIEQVYLEGGRHTGLHEYGASRLVSRVEDLPEAWETVLAEAAEGAYAEAWDRARLAFCDQPAHGAARQMARALAEGYIAPPCTRR